VFNSLASAPIDPSSVRHALPRAHGAVIRVIDVRHTATALILRSGVNTKLVSEWVGHATVAIKPQTYSHVLQTTQENAAKALDALLREGAPKLEPVPAGNALVQATVSV
jgi:integrase